MIVTLSDFSDSEYLGVMKGVIYSIYNNARVVDLYNNIDSQNVREGAWILFANYRYFPKGSIFLCVVDPGVGARRQCVAVKTKDYYFVGPDNGLMYPAALDNRIISVVKLSTKGASKTFHGRDVFTRASAKLEKGIGIGKLGCKIKLQTKLEFYKRGRDGEVVRVDYFGNIITNLESLNKSMYTAKFKNKVKLLKYYNTYEEAKQDELFLITGSANTLEISIKNKSANRMLKLKAGDRIEIY